jgi:hypothetical protein
MEGPSGEDDGTGPAQGPNPAPSDPSPDSLGDANAPPGRRRLGIVLGGVVVVAIVLVGLALYGGLGSQFDPLSHSPTSSVDSLGFEQAYGDANATAAATPGSWGLVSAFGLDVLPGGGSPLPGPNSTSVCHPVPVPPIVNAAPGNAENGLSPYWVFTFESTTNDSLLGMTVIHGQVGTVTTTPPDIHCDGTTRAGTLAPTSEIEDSPNAVASLRNLSGFLTQFPNSTVVFALGDAPFETSSVSGTAAWGIEASPCFAGNLSDGSDQGIGSPVYIGGTNATASRVLYDLGHDGLGHCAFPGTLGAALTLNASDDVVELPHAFDFVEGIATISAPVEASSFHPVILPGSFSGQTTAELSGGLLGFDVTNATGGVVANYSFSSSTWTTGGSVQLAVGDSLTVEAATDLGGNGLALVGNAPTTGDVGWVL